MQVLADVTISDAGFWTIVAGLGTCLLAIAGWAVRMDRMVTRIAVVLKADRQSANQIKKDVKEHWEMLGDVETRLVKLEARKA